ncbi:hypothetical protein [Aminobacter sp. LjRoot7]|uniref:hypothetical protein n=1 Tax=Aminobacter sp. LjRoot7 TaxID=3342335 RepID=UPI003F5044C1
MPNTDWCPKAWKKESPKAEHNEKGQIGRQLKDTLSSTFLKLTFNFHHQTCAGFMLVDLRHIKGERRLTVNGDLSDSPEHDGYFFVKKPYSVRIQSNARWGVLR